MKANPFDDFKFSPHSVGNLMTCLPGLSDVQTKKMLEYQKRANGAGRPLTEKMSAELEELTLRDSQEETPDTLPKGVQSALQDIADAVMYDRSEIVDTIYIAKGTLVEEDSLDLLSRVDGVFYKKNTARIENDLMIGTPDVWPDVKDVKSSWSLRTFRRADLSSIYDWQIKAYLWITASSDDTYTQRTGELVYCLVNAPVHIVMSEINAIRYRFGVAEGTERWQRIAEQVEINLIFDFALFKDDYSDYQFINDDPERYNMPERARVKRFDVTLTDDDIKAFEARLPICRQYLIDWWNKEKTNGRH